MTHQHDNKTTFTTQTIWPCGEQYRRTSDETGDVIRDDSIGTRVNTLEKPPTIEQLYAIIGTDMIELHTVMYQGEEVQVIMDEEGRLKGAERNNNVPKEIQQQLYGYPVGVWVMLQGKGLD